GAAVWPVPLKDTTGGVAVSLLANDSVPFSALAAAGAKRTVTICVPPTCSVNEDAVVRLKPAPVTVVELTVNGAPPVLETTTERSLVWPIPTFPNASEVVDKDSFGEPVALP